MKVRSVLKQKVLDRRSTVTPLLKRKDKLPPKRAQDYSYSLHGSLSGLGSSTIGSSNNSSLTSLGSTVNSHPFGVPLSIQGQGITDSQAAQARLARSLARPLGRTQSAPLPLWHPMLQTPAGILPPGAVPQPTASQVGSGHIQLFGQTTTAPCDLFRDRSLVKHPSNPFNHHIRQTVIQRTSSMSQLVENVVEETEAAVAQEMEDSQNESGTLSEEVMDLSSSNTKKKHLDGDDEPISSFDPPLIRHYKEHKAFLQQQRDLNGSPVATKASLP